MLYFENMRYVWDWVVHLVLYIYINRCYFFIIINYIFKLILLIYNDELMCYLVYQDSIWFTSRRFWLYHMLCFWSIMICLIFSVGKYLIYEISIWMLSYRGMAAFYPYQLLFLVELHSAFLIPICVFKGGIWF